MLDTRIMTHFKTKILRLYGDRGKCWLNDLPAIVRTMTEAYGLSELKPLNNPSYHYVLSGFKNNRPIILKLGLDPKGLEQEAATLQVFEGFGTVSVLGQRPGALLLERAIPGISLKSYFPSKDSEAIQIACAVMKRLHQAPRPKAGLFPAVQDWLAILDKPWDIPNQYLEKARRLRAQLLETSKQAVLLHGDLHHDNMLQYGEQWAVIDPKGVMGEPAYEVAAFIRNPIAELLISNNPMDILRNRIHVFSKILGLDRQRISDGCFVQAVLAWIWALEDGGDSDPFKQLTDIFNALSNNT